MSNKQQTAVEWLIEMHFGGIEHLTPYFRKHIEQAKEMEKEQTIKTSLFWSHSTVKRKDIEDYYNETYGGGEQ